MRSLPKELQAQHKELVARLADARRAVEDAAQAFNEVLDEAEAFCTDAVAGAIQDWMDERSEKWQESDAAAEVEDWKDQWEGVDLARIEDLDFDAEDVFASLPLKRGE